MAKLPKYNSSYLFHKLAQEVKKDFISENGRKPTFAEWNEIQKFTSKNLFQEFKGKSHKKVTVKEIHKEIELRTPAKEKAESCGNAFNVNPADYTIVEWWNIDNIIQGLPKDVKIRVNGGDYYGTTKIAQVYQFDYYEDILDIFEKIRMETGNKSDGNVFFEGMIKVVPDRKNDGKNCSYFIDFVLNDVNGSVSEDGFIEVIQKMTPDDKDRTIRSKNAERKKRVSKAEKFKKAKGRKRPSMTEEQAKSAKDTGEKGLKELEALRAISDNKVKALELLKEDYKDGIYTKAEYKKERAKIIDRFDDGGIV